jgi:hypothetical protein
MLEFQQAMATGFVEEGLKRDDPCGAAGGGGVGSKLNDEVGRYHKSVGMLSEMLNVPAPPPPELGAQPHPAVHFMPQPQQPEEDVGYAGEDESGNAEPSACGVTVGSSSPAAGVVVARWPDESKAIQDLARAGLQAGERLQQMRSSLASGDPGQQAAVEELDVVMNELNQHCQAALSNPVVGGHVGPLQLNSSAAASRSPGQPSSAAGESSPNQHASGDYSDDDFESDYNSSANPSRVVTPAVQSRGTPRSKKGSPVASLASHGYPASFSPQGTPGKPQGRAPSHSVLALGHSLSTSEIAEESIEESIAESIQYSAKS